MVLEKVPLTALQVTAAVVPPSVAENCTLPLAPTTGAPGLTTIASLIVTAVEADFEGSALLFAVTVSVPPAGTEAGAVYKPFDVIAPDTALQVRLVSLLLPLTVVENCCCMPVPTVGLAGLIGATLSFDPIVAVVLFDLLGSAWLVAVTVTLVLLGRSAGAV